MNFDKQLKKMLGKTKKNSFKTTQKTTDIFNLAKGSVFFPFTNPTVKTPTGKTIKGNYPSTNKVMTNFGLKKRLPKSKDWDFDGVPNWKDCQPRNTMRQDRIFKKTSTKKELVKENIDWINSVLQKNDLSEKRREELLAEKNKWETKLKTIKNVGRPKGSKKNISVTIGDIIPNIPVKKVKKQTEQPTQRKQPFVIRNTYIPKDDLITYQKEREKELNRPLQPFDFMKEPDLPSYGLFERRFGGFYKETQMPVIGGAKTNFTKEDLILYAREKERELGRPVTITDLQTDPNLPNYDVYRKYFRGWKQLQKEGKLKAAPRGRGVAKIRRKEQLQKLGVTENIRVEKPINKKVGDLNAIETQGQQINVIKLQESEPPQDSEYKSESESESELLIYKRPRGRQTKKFANPEMETIGGYNRGYTNEDLKTYYREKEKDIGRKPTIKDLNEDPEVPSYGFYRKEFGSIEQLRDELEELDDTMEELDDTVEDQLYIEESEEVEDDELR